MTNENIGGYWDWMELPPEHPHRVHRVLHYIEGGMAFGLGLTEMETIKAVLRKCSAPDEPCEHLEVLTDHEGTCRKCGVRTHPSGMLPDNRPQKSPPVHPDPTGQTREMPHCPSCSCGMAEPVVSERHGNMHLADGAHDATEAFSAALKSNNEPAHWARMREICTCPKPGTSSSSVDPLCPLALPHPWHRVPKKSSETWTCESCGMRGRPAEAKVCSNCFAMRTNEQL